MHFLVMLMRTNEQEAKMPLG